MRKCTTTLLAVLFLIVSCNKKEARLPAEEPIPEKGEVSLRNCAADEILQQQMAADPQRRKFLEELERKTEQYNGSVFRLDQTLYVPVVLHVVLKDPSIVSDAQITSQFNVLQKDFSKTNSELSNTSVYLAGYDYNKVANCKIEFYVSQVVRKVTTVSAFGTNDAVKKSSQGGSDPIDPTTKMNFWVCNLDGGLLGYAQFPGGDPLTDGIVVDYQAFGTTASYPLYSAFNLGRTATHEVGHWVNLRHIWGDRRCGTDGVSDTPAHDGSNGGCPAEGLKSACTGKPLEQWMNYMDYTDDRCMYMFSSGQKERMDAAIDNARKSYFYTSKI